MLGAQLAALLSIRGIVALAGLIIIAALIWFGGPYITFGANRPLADEFVRGGIIAALFLTVIAVVLVRHWLARRANRRMIKSLIDSEGLIATSDERSQEEVELIRERFEDALKVLREAVFAGKRGPGYLFELPWYIIIGPPGAGKTTILRNSRLEFPLAERLGVDLVAGFGGTRNCDWWFTDQAVLIDTAGRYTTQDTNAEVDRAAWRGFLDLLKTHRRRRPINGILVAVSLSDLLLRDEGAKQRHVEAIRSRLQELLKTFGMQIPVYVLITKCDLVNGFSEYFDTLDEEGRAQVWGKTFAVEGAGGRLVDAVGVEMQELAEGLEAGLPPLMHAERNLGRRATMFAFPKEFLSIRATVGGFVSDVFRASRFEIRPMLRGVYFTSGTQEGTPIDRIIAALGRNFGLQSGQRKSVLGQGKAFFIRRLLTDVIFAEQGLIGSNTKLERKLAMMHGAGYAAAVAALACALVLWYGAFTRSEARIAATTAAVQATQARLGELRGPGDFKALLAVLNAAQQMRIATGENSWFAWLDGIGISATPQLAPKAQSAYDGILVSRLLPAFADRLKMQIDALLRTGNEGTLDQVKELFRTYLMLGDPTRYDGAKVAEAARGQTALAYAFDPHAGSQLNEHFSRLLQLLPKPIKIDEDFAERVRGRLKRRPRTDQVYARLLREAAQNGRLHPVDLVNVIGAGQLEVTQPRGAQFAFPALNQSDAAVTTDGSIIPGIFTRDGFYNFVLPRLPALVREEEGADWVLAGQSVDNAGIQQLIRDVVDRYVADYIRVWNAALGSIRALSFNDMQRGAGVLRGLAGPQSALQQLVATVRDNTNLPAPGAGSTATAAEPATAANASRPAAATQLASVGGSVAGVAYATAFGDEAWPGNRISEAFRPLSELAMTPSGGQAPAMERIRNLLGGLYATMSGVATAPDPTEAAFQLVQKRIKNPNADAFGELRADAVLRPEPVRSILNDVTNSTWAALLAQAHDYINGVWTREVLPVCQGTIFQRYPIYASATDDITLKDFSDFFRPAGVIDGFFQKYLAPLVVDRRTGFVPARIDGVAVPIPPAALAQFQRASEIRKAFFSGSGSAPGIKFSLKPVFLDSRILRATFSMDGKDIVYRHEAPRAYDLDWPTRAEASTASVSLALTDGTQQRVERSGPWALFRLVDASQLSSRGTADRFSISIATADGARMTYALQAASVTNPFSLDVLRSFRCPDNL